MGYSEFTEEDFEVIRKAHDSLMEAARKRCRYDKEIEMVEKAFNFANEAHKNVRRRSGEPYILHPIDVAKIVVNNIGLGYKSISAALLHDVVEDTDYTVEDLREQFGDKIATLVDGLTKMKTVLDNQDRTKQDEVYLQSLQAENFKRILLTMNDDVRVVLIKLADRLHNCRTIDFMPEHKRDKILSETMYIFIPLAHRLGLYAIKSEMENIWLKFKEPEAYSNINNWISQKYDDQTEQIDSFIKPIEESLRQHGFDFEIKKRVKSPYSVWRKMKTKNVTFDEVYDIYALRIIFNPDPESNESERDQCYHVFSIVTSIYSYMPERIRDWVKYPKSNGYESLHCTLMSAMGVWFEVQIRSKRMDDIAEKGIAAHWAYKREGYISENDSEMDKWLAKVQDILVNPDVNALELLDIIHNDLTYTEIVVFTPKGEQVTIQKGATALDYAYALDPEKIGNKAIAAKVNMKLEALSRELHTGDQVEIITAENAQPKQEWLQFLQTRKAKVCVKDYFSIERSQIVEFGRKTLEDQLDSLGYKLDEEIEDKILSFYSVSSMENVYFRIGMGLLKLGNLQQIVSGASSRKKFSFSSLFGKKKYKEIRPHYLAATCCNPIIGDAVVGIKGPNGTITVHKKSCPIADNIASKHGDWIVVPDWENEAAGNFVVRISISGIDRVGLLNELSRYISLVMGVNMRTLNLISENGIVRGHIDLCVENKNVLNKMVKKISTIEGIQSVVRTDL